MEDLLATAKADKGGLPLTESTAKQISGSNSSSTSPQVSEQLLHELIDIKMSIAVSTAELENERHEEHALAHKLRQQEVEIQELEAALQQQQQQQRQKPALAANASSSSLPTTQRKIPAAQASPNPSPVTASASATSVQQHREYQVEFAQSPLGVALTRNSANVAEVSKLVDGGRAMQMGVRRGDIVVGVGGGRVCNYDETMACISSTGFPLLLVFHRSQRGEGYSATVTPSASKDDVRSAANSKTAAAVAGDHHSAPAASAGGVGHKITGMFGALKLGGHKSGSTS